MTTAKPKTNADRTATAKPAATNRRRAKTEPVEGKPKLRPELTIVETQVFRGPNYWSYDPCVRLLVDLGVLEHWPSNTIPGFVDGLLAMLPGVGDHSCSLGKQGGFRERLLEGTWAGHVAEHIALELQRESGAHVYRGKTPTRSSQYPKITLYRPGSPALRVLPRYTCAPDSRWSSSAMCSAT